MRILGIDPGIATTGFAVIERSGSTFTPVWYDSLTTTPREATAARLLRIAQGCREAIAQLQPSVAAIESLYFGASAPSALAAGQARGVLMLVCAEAGLDVFEYTPAVVKQAVTGYGRADKGQVQRMVQTILGMTEIPQPDHCADAFAVAIAHSGSLQVPAATSTSARTPV